jgi:hypothetical protein
VATVSYVKKQTIPCYINKNDSKKSSLNSGAKDTTKLLIERNQFQFINSICKSKKGCDWGGRTAG